MSRFQSVASTRCTQTQFNPFLKRTKLPPHVEDVLHAKHLSYLQRLDNPGQGLYMPKHLLPSLDLKDKPLPWEKSGTSESSRSSLDAAGSGRGKYGFMRPKSIAPESNVEQEGNKFRKLEEIAGKNPFGKITFTNTNEPMHPMAGWVTHRLEQSCRSARFALPSDYTLLQNMTPLEYLEKYVVLTPAQRRRYDLLFKKFMDKQEKCIPYEKLYPALNSMFADSLGEANFKILHYALCLDHNFKVTSKDLFAGICTLTERLFWSSYLESNYNTFLTLGENRSLLECADFCGLKWKIRDLNILVPLRLLLFSLA